MLTEAPFRRFSREFKLQLCADVRAGIIGRREAERTHRLSSSLLATWLKRFDAGLLSQGEEPVGRIADVYEGKIAELERRVGQLTMEVERLRGALMRASASNDDQPAGKGQPKRGAKARNRDA